MKDFNSYQENLTVYSKTYWRPDKQVLYRLHSLKIEMDRDVVWS